MNTAANKIQPFITAVQNIEHPPVILQNEDLKPFLHNTLDLARELLAVIQVTNALQIAAIVRLANIYRVALYPISTGKNWGLGSRTPVMDNCVLLDTHAMNKIQEINTEFGYARIEPGVTQAQLAQALVDINAPFFIDVTGSGRDTSIIGNTLERGTAYNSLRAETLINMEVILGNGETITTGYEPGFKVANLYPYGIGPDMLGLFLQSNFGICISACIKLLPRQEFHTAFIASVNTRNELMILVDRLRELFDAKTLNCIVHIGNERRRDISLTPIIFNLLQKQKSHLNDRDKPASAEQERLILENVVRDESKGSWSAVGSIMGSKEQVATTQKILKRKLNNIAKVSFMDNKKHSLLSFIANLLSLQRKTWFLHAIQPLIGLTQGKPTDEMLRSIYWPSQNTSENWLNPDSSNSGVYFCAPLLPMNSSAIHSALTIIEQHANDLSVKPAITMNTLRGCVLECVISIDFIKSDELLKNSAHQFISDVLDSFIAAGYPPYRIDIGNMNKIFKTNKSIWPIASQLKAAFDPNNIIAPGRYSLQEIQPLK